MNLTDDEAALLARLLEQAVSKEGFVHAHVNSAGVDLCWDDQETEKALAGLLKQKAFTTYPGGYFFTPEGKAAGIKAIVAARERTAMSARREALQVANAAAHRGAWVGALLATAGSAILLIIDHRWNAAKSPAPAPSIPTTVAPTTPPAAPAANQPDPRLRANPVQPVPLAPAPASHPATTRPIP